MAALTAIPGRCGRGLQAEDLLDHAGPDVRLGIEATDPGRPGRAGRMTRDRESGTGGPRQLRWHGDHAD